MSANIDQVMRVLDYRGIDVRLVAGRLVGRARHGDMPADIVRFVRHFKDLIIAELAERERLEETANNILALSPDEWLKYRAELAAAVPGDPYIMHDRRAYRMAIAWMAERSEAA
jgi:hypothetical protein